MYPSAYVPNTATAWVIRANWANWKKKDIFVKHICPPWQQKIYNGFVKYICPIQQQNKSCFFFHFVKNRWPWQQVGLWMTEIYDPMKYFIHLTYVSPQTYKWLGLCNIIGLPLYCNILVSNTYCNTFFRIAIYCVLSLRTWTYEFNIFSLEIHCH